MTVGSAVVWPRAQSDPVTDTQASSASAAAERAEPNVAGVSGLEFEVQAMTMDLSLLSGTTRLSNGRKVTVR